MRITALSVLKESVLAILAGITPRAFAASSTVAVESFKTIISFEFGPRIESEIEEDDLL